MENDLVTWSDRLSFDDIMSGHALVMAKRLGFRDEELVREAIVYRLYDILAEEAGENECH